MPDLTVADLMTGQVDVEHTVVKHVYLVERPEFDMLLHYGTRTIRPNLAVITYRASRGKGAFWTVLRIDVWGNRVLKSGATSTNPESQGKNTYPWVSYDTPGWLREIAEDMRPTSASEE